MDDAMRHYMGTQENPDLRLMLVYLYSEAKEYIPILLPKSADFIVANDTDMKWLADYIRLFWCGVIYGIFACWVGENVVSHFVEVSYYLFEFQYRALSNLLLETIWSARCQGKIPKGAEREHHYDLAFGYAKEWIIISAGYFSYAILVYICCSAVWVVLRCFGMLSENLGSASWLVLLGLFLLVLSMIHSILRLLRISGEFVFRWLVIPLLKFYIFLVEAAKGTYRVILQCSFMLWRTYKYSDHELGDRQIRLLRIQKKSVFGVIRCEIFPVSLKEVKGKHAYQAISYTWGSATGKRLINLNKCRFEVPEIVYELLKDRSSWTNEPVIWIDSICINQQDNTDKDSQVRLMRDIYKNASDVLVWLGNPRNADWAMTFIADINAEFKKSTKAAALEKIEQSLWAKKTSYPLGYPPVIAFSSLLSHVYWKRVWIVQEVVAASHLAIYFGGYYVAWDDFVRVADCFRGATVMTLLDTRGSGGDPSGLTLVLEMKVQRDYYAEGNRVQLWLLLSNHIRRQATDLRDKVYALQGISTEPDALPINYGQDVTRVYTDAARYFSNQGTLLNVLCYAGIGWNYPVTYKPIMVLPSWVPNWSQPPAITTIAMTGVMHNACGGHAPRMKIIDNLTLSLGGILVDEIKVLTSSPSILDTAHLGWNYSDTEDFSRKVLDFYNEALGISEANASDPYPYTSQPLPEVFWRTLVCDRGRGQTGRPAPASVGDDIQKYLDVLKRAGSLASQIIESAGPENDCENTENFNYNLLPRLLKEGRIKPDALDFVDISTTSDIVDTNILVSTFTFLRRVAVTKKGYLAIVPPRSEVGDVVGIVLGAETPFVFRASEGKERVYALVGECYVHGIMDGEVLVDPTKESVDFIVR